MDLRRIESLTKSHDLTWCPIQTVLTYYLPDGTKIAEATFTGIDSDNTAKVITFKDQNTTSVSIHESSKTKDVAAFLSENGYL